MVDSLQREIEALETELEALPWVEGERVRPRSEAEREHDRAPPEADQQPIRVVIRKHLRTRTFDGEQ